MNKYTLNTVHDDELLLLTEKLDLRDKFNQGKFECKFIGTIITFDKKRNYGKTNICKIRDLFI